MTVEQIIGLILALLVMLVGTVGTALPGLPGTPVLVIAALLHKLYFGPDGAAWWVLVVLFLFMLLSIVLDWLATVVGAKKLGATWKGMTGAVIGGVIGIFFSIPGILIGPFIGALAFEMIGGRNFKESSKAGAGATIGLLVGVAGKVACCVAMMGLFAVNVVIRSLD